MSNRILVAVLISGLVAVVGCGESNDEAILMPTPTQGPPTPTPVPICRGIDVPAGLGARPFGWTQPESAEDSGTQLFSSLPMPGGFDFLPSLLADGLDPGGKFTDIPPGLCLLAGAQDPVTGVAPVTIGVTPENQLAPGFVVIGMKPILDYICLKIELESIQGRLFCTGSDSEGIDTRVTAVEGVTPEEDDVLEFGLGDSVPPGALEFRFIQQQGRIRQGASAIYEECFELPECGPGLDDDDRFDCYRPRTEVVFTTGRVFGMKGLTPLLDSEGAEGLSGEPFDCAAWEQLDGPGQLVQGLVDFDSLGGDVATALRIDD